MSDVVEYLSRDYNRRRLLHINAPMVITNMIGIRASLAPACAMVQPPPPPPSAGGGAGAAGAAVKVAVTVAVALTTQVPVPAQPPPVQPLNVDPPVGAAESVTEPGEGNDPLQAAPQLIPDGLEVTVPVPVPALVTVTVKLFTTLTTALRAFSRRPVATRPVRSAEASPVFRIASLICATVKFGLTASRRPTTPVTCGVAIEVPAKN